MTLSPTVPIQAALYAAIQASPIPRWSKASRHLYFCYLTAFLCSNANGYGASARLFFGTAHFPQMDPL